MSAFVYYSVWAESRAEVGNPFYKQAAAGLGREEEKEQED